MPDVQMLTRGSVMPNRSLQVYDRAPRLDHSDMLKRYLASVLQRLVDKHCVLKICTVRLQSECTYGAIPVTLALSLLLAINTVCPR